MATSRGPEAALAELKDFLGRAREDWLNSRRFTHGWVGHLPDRLTAQVSMAKRALPTASERDVRKNLEAHEAALTSEFTCEAAYLERAEDFALRWALRHCPRGPMSARSCSDSACVEYTRREGGQARRLREIADRELPPSQTPSIPGTDPGQVEQEVFDLRLTQLCYEELEDVVYPLAQAEVVNEFGMKARIVTKSPAALVHLAHMARRRIFKGLRRDAHIAAFLSGDYERGLQRFRGAEGMVLSSDFKSASDLLPLDLVRAVVRGLVRSGRFTVAEVLALTLCTGPQVVRWPNGHRHITSRGILMGLPTTWGILNLCHLFWWSEALRVNRDNRIRHKPVFACFGDDALIVAHPKILDSYEAACRAGGMILSPGKHARTMSRGVFLERLLEVQGPSLVDKKTMTLRRTHLSTAEGGGRITQAMRSANPGIGVTTVTLRSFRLRHVSSLRIDEAVPLRGLLWPDGRETDGHRRQPAWAVLGLTTETQAETFGSQRVFRVQRFAHERLVGEVLRRRVPSLPRALGGSGLLPSPKGWLTLVSRVASRRARIALGVLAQSATTEHDPAVFSRVWSSAQRGYPDYVFEEGEKLVEGYATPLLRKGPTPWGHTFGWVVEDLPSKIMLSLMQQINATTGKAATHLPFSNTVKRLHKVRDDLVSTWRSMKPVGGTIQKWIDRLGEWAQKAFYYCRPILAVEGVGADDILSQAYSAWYFKDGPPDGVLEDGSLLRDWAFEPGFLSGMDLQMVPCDRLESDLPDPDVHVVGCERGVYTVYLPLGSEVLLKFLLVPPSYCDACQERIRLTVRGELGGVIHEEYHWEIQEDGSTPLSPAAPV